MRVLSIVLTFGKEKANFTLSAGVTIAAVKSVTLLVCTIEGSQTTNS
jgi:hypothetical protein